MANLDPKRLRRYCLTIQENVEDIRYLLSEYSDQELLEKRYLLKALKYSLIEIAEAMADVLQHMLAKLKGEAAESYLEVAEKARSANLMDSELLGRLMFFFKFRNLLVHRYWEIDNHIDDPLWPIALDRLATQNCRRTRGGGREDQRDDFQPDKDSVRQEEITFLAFLAFNLSRSPERPNRLDPPNRLNRPNRFTP